MSYMTIEVTIEDEDVGAAFEALVTVEVHYRDVEREYVLETTDVEFQSGKVVEGDLEEGRWVLADESELAERMPDWETAAREQAESTAYQELQGGRWGRAW
jgi:hypothetical protein